MEEGEIRTGELPTISLHALFKTNDYQTMRMRGRIKKSR